MNTPPPGASLPPYCSLERSTTKCRLPWYHIHRCCFTLTRHRLYCSGGYATGSLSHSGVRKDTPRQSKCTRRSDYSSRAFGALLVANCQRYVAVPAQSLHTCSFLVTSCAACQQRKANNSSRCTPHIWSIKKQGRPPPVCRCQLQASVTDAILLRLLVGEALFPDQKPYLTNVVHFDGLLCM